MFIMLVLAILAVALVIAGLCVLVFGILSGTILLRWGKLRFLALIALFVLPLGSIGGVAGAFLLGHYLITLNGNFLLWGPVIGLVGGTLAGVILGGFLVSITWLFSGRKRATAIARPLG